MYQFSRKGQDGCRKNKSTVDQIFILCNIIEEQVYDWQETVICTLCRLRKRFGLCTPRKIVGRIMKVYGIPEKLIRMVKITYDDFECSVLNKGEQSRWFKIITGFKKGRVMSCFLFLLTVD